MVCTGSIAAQRMLEAAGYETLAQSQSQRFHLVFHRVDFLRRNHRHTFSILLDYFLENQPVGNALERILCFGRR